MAKVENIIVEVSTSRVKPDTFRISHDHAAFYVITALLTAAFIGALLSMTL